MNTDSWPNTTMWWDIGRIVEPAPPCCPISIFMSPCIAICGVMTVPPFLRDCPLSNHSTESERLAD